MKTILAYPLCAGVLLATAAFCAEPPSAGKVLVLEGDRTLEGDVERVGNEYRVRRPVGETWLPTACVLRICADNVDALNYLRSRTNLDDPDERLRLARWCLDRGLQEQALLETQAALQIRPGHAPSQQLLDRLQHPVPNATPRPPDPPAPVEGDTPATVDLTTEALAQFTTKVQPILLNACAGCHANGRGGSFKLTRVGDSLAPNRKTIQQNLAAVMAQVDPQQPQNSRLLSKAVALHGDMDKAPPLPNRQAPAYRALEKWVRLTAESNPQLHERGVALQPPAAPQLPPEPKPASDGFASDQRTDTITAPTDEARKPAAAGQPAMISPTRSVKNPEEKPPAASPADPYDPDEFNRQEHPQRTKPPKKPA
jgi:hypothetical protein